MPIIEIYKKKGNIPLKEKNMVAQIRARVEQMMETNPDFKISPAESPAELEKLYHKICSDEVEFEDVKQAEKTKEPTDKNIDMKESAEPEEKVVEETIKDKKSLGEFDPFSAEEVKVRHYVLEEEFQTVNSNEAGATVHDFSEPTTFKESFEIPAFAESDDLTDIDDESELNNAQAKSSSSSNQSQSQGHSAPPPPRPEAQGSMNPNYENMDGARQRKKTKRFAKQIVSLTCDLMEKGFVWFATKNISESKLTQYELDNEMDLSIFVEMPNGQKATVKQFFLSQHKVILEESIISEEDRLDLTDALAEVLMEKGIAPTPMQELMLTTARIVGLQAVKVIAITSSNNAILNQLRGFKGEEEVYEEQPAYTPPPTPQAPAPEPSKTEPLNSESTSTTSDESVFKKPRPNQRGKNKGKNASTDLIETVPFTEIPTKE